MLNQIMAKAIGVFAFLVFASSAVAHVATFFPTIHVPTGMVGPQHFAMMAVFAAMIFSVAALHKRQPKKTVKGLFANWRAANQQKKEFESKLIAPVPFPLRVACAAAFLYAFINFFVSGVHMAGNPSVKNGNYFLESHGKKVRDITEEEYHRYQAFEVRFISGEWILFSIIPAVYFLVVHPRLLSETQSDAKEASEL